jgi:ElaB/YqjD/DUF883 family membrane-anchored ribosome-binding protein
MATVMESKLGEILAKEGKEMTDRMEKVVNSAKAAASETLEDGRVAAGRLWKRGQDAAQNAVEDGVTQTLRQVRRNPGRSIAIAFAAGAVFAMLAPKLVKKS